MIRPAQRCNTGDKITISNSAPYAAALETGVGRAQPAAMVRKTSARVPGFVREAVA